ncbi:hypothetical protein FRC08_005736 [Ceratobasidium sp. 394]|nr:hypothetical protein FRC08_005736 [Ceratobasidium sp. 394]
MSTELRLPRVSGNNLKSEKHSRGGFQAKARDKLPPKRASEGDSDCSDGSDEEQGGGEAEDKGSEGDDESEGDKRTGAGKEKGKSHGWGDLDGSGDEEQGNLPDAVAFKPKSMDELKKMSQPELLAYMMQKEEFDKLRIADLGEGGDEVVVSRASAAGSSKRARSRTPPVVQKRKRHIEEVEDLSGPEGKGDEGGGSKRKDKMSKARKWCNGELKELSDAKEKSDEDESKRKDKASKGKHQQRSEEVKELSDTEGKGEEADKSKRKNKTSKGKGKQRSKAVEGVGSDTEGKEGEVGLKGQDRVFDNAFKGVVRKAFYNLGG